MLPCVSIERGWGGLHKKLHKVMRVRGTESVTLEKKVHVNKAPGLFQLNSCSLRVSRKAFGVEIPERIIVLSKWNMKHPGHWPYVPPLRQIGFFFFRSKCFLTLPLQMAFDHCPVFHSTCWLYSYIYCHELSIAVAVTGSVCR